MNVCPICQLDLIEVWDGFECPTQVKDIRSNYRRFISHYKDEEFGTQRIMIGEFQLIISDQGTSTQNIPKKFYIHKWDDRRFVQVLVTDPFPLKSEEQLLHRLKTLVVFS